MYANSYSSRSIRIGLTTRVTFAKFDLENEGKDIENIDELCRLNVPCIYIYIFFLFIYIRIPKNCAFQLFRFGAIDKIF